MATRSYVKGFGFTYQLTGVEQTIQEIKSFDKKLYNRLSMQLRRAAQQVQKDAVSAAPSVTGAMRAGYRVKKQTGWRSKYTLGFKVVNLTPEGSILEFAGSVSDGDTPQGRSLIATVRERYGQPAGGRFAWAAYDRRADEMEATFVAAVKAAEAEMQSRLNTIH